jgi:hypothetical protein
MYLNYRQQCSLDWHTALLAAFAFDMDNHGSVVCGADISDVGLAQLVCAQARRRAGSEQARDLFQPNMFGPKKSRSHAWVSSSASTANHAGRLDPRSKSRPAPCGLIGGVGVVEVGGRKLCDEGLFVSIAVVVGRGQGRSHTFNVQ